MADSSLTLDKDRLRFHIRPHRMINCVLRVQGIESLQSTKMTNNILVVGWRGKTIAHISKKNSKLPFRFQVDYFFVSNNSFVINKKWTGSKKIRKLIVDGSNSRIYINKMRKFATAENIPFYSVLYEGAFTLTN